MYGTVCSDINNAGSLLCQNSSFTSCKTDPKSFQNQHYSTTTPFSISTSHFFLLCTFKSCTSDTSRSSCIHSTSSPKLAIEQCSFQECHTTTDTISGGAIFVTGTSETVVSITTSCFVDCSSAHEAGNCLGGSIISAGWDSKSTDSIFSNILFQNSKTTNNTDAGSGGAVTFSDCTSIALRFLRFANNSAASNLGNDILFANESEPAPIWDIVFCESSSLSPQVTITDFATYNNLDDLLSSSSAEVEIQSSSISEVDDTTALLSITLNRTVTGPVLILVDNSEDSGTSREGAAPTIPRVLAFSIDGEIDSSHAFSFGEAGLLQSPLTSYTVSAISFPPDTPTLISVSCSLDESRTKADLVFTGALIASGQFLVTLNGSRSFSVSFTLDSDGMSTAKTTLLLNGNEEALAENTLYQIESVVSQTVPQSSVNVLESIQFKTPEAARLIEVHVGELTGLKKDSLNLSFSSVLLEKNTEYIVRFNLNGDTEGSQSMSHTIPTDDNGDLLDLKVCFLPSSEEDTSTLWQHDAKYTITSVVAENRTESALISDHSISMPSEPIRVTQTESLGLLGTKKSLAIVVTGQGFPPSLQSLSVRRGDTIALSDSIEMNENNITAHFSTSSSENETTLAFGQEYSLYLFDGSSDFGVCGTISFRVPSPPLITSFWTELSESHQGLYLKVNGSNLSPDTSYIATINDNKVTITISSTTHGSSSEIPVRRGESLMEFGKTYTVTAMTKDDNESEHAFLENSSFSTPDGPEVIAVECNLDDMRTGADVIVKGRSIPNGEYEIVLNTADRFRVNLTLDEEGESSGKVRLRLDGSEGGLKEDEPLKVTEVNAVHDEEMVVGVKGTVEFVTPKVARLEKIDVGELDSVTKSNLTLSFTSSLMEKGKEYKVTLVRVVEPITEEGESGGEDQEPTEERIVISCRTDEQGVLENVTIHLSPSCFGEEGSNEMRFGENYAITSVVGVGRNESVLISEKTISMPSEPIRVTGIDSVALSGPKKSLTIVVTGRGFPLSLSSLSVRRDDTTVSCVSNEMNENNITARFSTSSSENETTLAFGKEYSLYSFNESTDFGVCGSISFRVPSPPLITSFSTTLSSDRTGFILTAAGSNLPQDTPYTVTIGDFSFNFSFSTPTSGSSSFIPVGLESSLLFNTTYHVTSLVREDDKVDYAFIINNSFTTPEGPKLTSIDYSLKPTDGNYINLSLVGEDIPDGPVKLTIQRLDYPTSNVTVEVTINEVLPIKVYKDAFWNYDLGYEVISASCCDISLLFSTDTFITIFRTPPKPIRFTNTSCKLNAQKNMTLSITLEADDTLAADTNLTVSVRRIVNGEPKDPAICLGTITVTSPTKEATLGVLVFEPKQKLLDFETTYEVTSVVMTPDVCAVDDGITFTVPQDEPRALSVTCLYDDEDKLTLNVDGLNFREEGETLSFQLTGVQTRNPGSSIYTPNSYNITIEVTTHTSTFASALVEFAEDDLHLRYSYTYTIKFANFTAFDAHLHTTSLSTPSKHRLGSVSCHSDQKDQDYAIIEFKGKTILNGSYTVVLQKTGSRNITQTLTMTDKNTGQLRVLAYKQKDFEYDSEFKIVDMFNETDIITLPPEEDRTFSIPPAPPRITSATCTFLDAEQTSIQIVFSGEDLPHNKGDDAEINVIPLLDGAIRDDPVQSLYLPIASPSSLQPFAEQIFESWGASFEYGMDYTLSSVKIGEISGFLPSEIVFSVPQEPLRVVSIEIGNETNLVEIKLIGRLFAKGENYTLTLIGNNPDPSEMNKTPSTHTLTVTLTGQSSTNAFGGVSVTKDDSSKLIARYSYTITAISNGILSCSPSDKSFKAPKYTQLEKNNYWTIFVAVAAAVGALIVVIIFVISCCCRHRKKKQRIEQNLAAQNVIISSVIIGSEKYLLISSSGAKKLTSSQLALLNKSKSSTISSAASTKEMLSQVIISTNVTEGEQSGVITGIRLNGVVARNEVMGKETIPEHVKAVKTLSTRLHKESNSFGKRQAQREIASGLVKLVASDIDKKDILMNLNSHFIMFDENESMILKLSGFDQQNWDPESTDNVIPPNEMLRYSAPEQCDENDQTDDSVDPQKVAVFRLGLLLYEMEAEETPLQEMDALTAHRQITAGVRPKLSKVLNDQMRELIEKCLDPDPEYRPTLTTVATELGFIEETRYIG
ncbi:hypothetical protein BLNAU_11251 [Blattamonas nauphoetae]|uniref:Protein kinase domain-containing protein n=1 Tax=Blattamonas nauphoetae TaxID=2049346 RepID=A0ABQ9XN70_9EUKA|nr:hypothetical protein BLNAU_11251 [Blattamonas nauphoetae]